jgi:site-specific DNA recombinase
MGTKKYIAFARVNSREQEREQTFLDDKILGTKNYIALARVSSREQERQGYSLDVQVEALDRYAMQHGGEISKLWRIAETAGEKDERQAFKEIIAYAKKHAAELDGFLVYKIDRAARNMPDFVELERLESEHGVRVIAIGQRTDDNAAPYARSWRDMP